MQTVKTAISLDKQLFGQTEALAQELNVSRSRLIAMALEAFILQQQNRNLLDKINAAYADDEQVQEQRSARAVLTMQRKRIEDQW